MAKPEREHQRYAHEAAITLRIGAEVVHGRTRNVSKGGLCAELAAPYPIGTEVEVDLQLVFDDNRQSDALRLPALVVWCTSLDERNQVGLAFKPLTGDKVKYLMLFLKHLTERAEPAAMTGNGSIDDRFR